jgi:uncharacterized protein YndB with AHSA1/START domain
MWIVVAVIAIVAAVLLLAARRPDAFRVERRSGIAAAPEAIFALITDFHEWPKWSPWESLDPAMTRSLSGASSGKGAVYEWQGNKRVGQGRMEIIKIVPARQIDIDLQFMAPWQAHNQAQFTLSPVGSGTQVTWAMTGVSPFMFKLMGLFMNMDQMIGKDFEKGLANLKRVAESGA